MGKHLKPIQTKNAPAYPAKYPKRKGKTAKTVAAAVAVGAAMLTAGCDSWFGTRTAGEPPPAVLDPDDRTIRPGGVPMRPTLEPQDADASDAAAAIAAQPDGADGQTKAKAPPGDPTPTKTSPETTKVP